MKTKLLLIFLFISVIAYGQNVLDLVGTNHTYRIVDNGNNDLDVSTAYTFEFWINVNSFTEFDRVMYRDNVFNIRCKNPTTSGYKIEMYGTDGTGGALIATDDLALNTWYHVAFSFEVDGTTNRMRLFVDGAWQRTSTDTDWDLVASGNSLSIASRWTGSYSQFLSAKLDEIRISNNTRYTANFTPSVSHLDDANTLLLFKFETTATPPTNSATNFTFTINNSPNGIVAGDYSSEAVPVQLISFSASSTDVGVLLNWETATEVNNYGFEIQASTSSATEWETIGFVNGHGNSNSPKSYTFVDVTIAERSRSYRLKQIDTDGAYEYSDVIELNGTNLDKIIFAQNYPNPFNPSTTFSFSIPNKKFVTLAIYNSLGQKVANIANETMNAGTYNFNWDATEIRSGVYFARLNVGAKTQIQKIMLLK